MVDRWERFKHMRFDNPDDDTDDLPKKYEHMHDNLGDNHSKFEQFRYYGEGRGHPHPEWYFVPYWVREPTNMMKELREQPKELGPYHFYERLEKYGYTGAMEYENSPRFDLRWDRIMSQYGTWPVSLQPQNIDPKTGVSRKPVEYPDYKKSWDRSVKLRDYIARRNAELNGTPLPTKPKKNFADKRQPGF